MRIKMRYISLISPVISLLLGCNGCHFSKGFSKDLTTTLSVKYNGFTIGRFLLTDNNNRPLKDNKVQGDIPFRIVGNGIEGYTTQEGKVYPGCALTITDPAGKQILEIPDLFAGQPEGISPEDAANIAAIFTIPAQAGIGKKFHVQSRIFDKKNTENEIIATADVLLQ